MRPTLDDGLRALQQSAELATAIQIELTPDYLRLIAAVEALPENQSGAAKPNRWRGRPNRHINRRGPFLPRHP